MHSTLSSDACLKSNGGRGGDEETEEDLTANNIATTTTIAASLPSIQTQNDTPTQPVEQMQTNPVDTSMIKSEYLADDTNNTNAQSLLKRKFLSTESMNQVAVSSLTTHVNTSEQTTQQVHNETSSELLNSNNAELAAPSSFDPQRYLDEDIDENAKQSLLKTTTEQLKKKICILRLKQLNDIRHECIDNLSEQFYLEKNLNYADMGKWKAEQQQTVMANKGPNMDENTLKLSEFVQKRFTNNGDVFTLEKSLANKFKSSLPLIEHSSNILSVNSGVVVTATASSSSSSLAVTSTSNKQQQHQTIAERAKHEAQILQRISQLRKEGLWSIKRLPKLVEPTRAKTHWDFVLDEMTWMSTDFQQERKWKKNCSKKLAIAIQKYFKEKELKADLAEREETKRLRKQANLVARDIMQFWRNVEKIIEYKQRTLMEEKRKHALDIHLNFIVDQTEKYSSWLMEGLNANAAQAEASFAAIAQGSAESEQTTSGNNKEKKDF
jgi:hypothetical protein